MNHFGHRTVLIADRRIALPRAANSMSTFVCYRGALHFAIQVILPMRTEGLESARLASFAELLPLQYGLAVIFMALKIGVMAGSAPWPLAVALPGLLGVLAIVRGLQWARMPKRTVPEAVAAALMQRSAKLVLVAGCVFLINDAVLYAYATGSQRTFMVVLMLMACVCQLFYYKYIPKAATITATMYAVTTLLLVIWSRDATLLATALLVFTIIGIMSHAVYTHHGEFLSLVEAHAELRRLWRENERLASTDALTGLANRREFFKDMSDTHRRTAAKGGSFAIGVADLDGFKTANDTFGHAVGDQVLVTVAARLQQITGDLAKPYRLGGDEFAFIVEEMAQPEVLKLLGESIIASISQPMACKETTVRVGCSIGIAVFPAATDDVGKLYEAADEALYASKHRGRGCVTFYERPEAGEALERIAG